MKGHGIWLYTVGTYSMGNELVEYLQDGVRCATVKIVGALRYPCAGFAFLFLTEKWSAAIT